MNDHIKLDQNFKNSFIGEIIKVCTHYTHPFCKSVLVSRWPMQLILSFSDPYPELEKSKLFVST